MPCLSLSRRPAALVLLALLTGAVAACTPPQPRCPAGAELATIDRLVAETSANIERGYVLAPAQGPDVDVCLGGQRMGVGLSLCADAARKERPVAVDIGAERRKLAGLKARRIQLEREMAASAACAP
jgi:hypothetical protein